MKEKFETEDFDIMHLTGIFFLVAKNLMRCKILCICNTHIN